MKKCNSKILICIVISVIMILLCQVSIFADETRLTGTGQVYAYPRFTINSNGDMVVYSTATSSSKYYCQFVPNLEPNKTYTLYWYPTKVSSYYGYSQWRWGASSGSYITKGATTGSNINYTTDDGVYYMVITTSPQFGSTILDSQLTLAYNYWNGSSWSLADAGVLSDFVVYVAEGDVHNNLPSSPPMPDETYSVWLNGTVLNWSSVSPSLGALGYRIDYHIPQSDQYMIVGRTDLHDTQYDLSGRAGGTYIVNAITPNADIQLGSVNYVPPLINKPQLDKPTISYDAPTLLINRVSNAYSYEIYKDGMLVYTVPGSNAQTIGKSINEYGSGLYTVKAISDSSQYADSPLSDPLNVVVASWESTHNVAPNKADYEGNTIGFLVDYIEYVFNAVRNGIVNLVQSGVNGIQTISSYITSFAQSFGTMFDFLPSELRIVIVSFFSIVAVWGIIKFFK